MMEEDSYYMKVEYSWTRIWRFSLPCKALEYEDLIFRGTLRRLEHSNLIATVDDYTISARFIFLFTSRKHEYGHRFKHGSGFRYGTWYLQINEGTVTARTWEKV